MSVGRILGTVLLTAGVVFATTFAIARSGDENVEPRSAAATAAPETLAAPDGPRVSALARPRTGFPALAEPAPSATAAPIAPAATASPDSPEPAAPQDPVVPATPQEDGFGTNSH